MNEQLIKISQSRFNSMIFVLWRKSIQESKWLLCGCALAMVAMGWIFVWVVSQLDTSRFQQLLDLLPGNLKRFTSVDIDWMITYTGRISMLFDEPLVVLALIIFCITRASDSVSGEIGRGTMEMVLSQPVSRLQVLLANWLVTLVGIGLLVCSLWLGIFLGISTTEVTETSSPSLDIPLVGISIPIPFAPPIEEVVPMAERVDVWSFSPAVLSFFCLGVFMAGLTAFLSSFDRYRWRTIGIVSAIYVVGALLKIAGMAAPEFSWLLWFTFFTPYEPEAFVALAEHSPDDVWSLTMPGPDGTGRQLGPLSSNLLLVGAGALFHTLGAVIFCRRDIPAPI